MGIYVKHIQTIFEKALKITQNDQVIVIYDESINYFIDDIVEYIIDKNLYVTLIYLPIPYQKNLVKMASSQSDQDFILPAGLLGSIPESSVILNLLSGDIETTRLRKAIVNQIRPKDCRLAHIPGLTPEVLELTYNSPFDDILFSSENIAWILGEAHDIQIDTQSADGSKYSLKLYLNGWYNEPLMSPGVLFPGSWGNIPPGETFCCPDPIDVNGIIVINGSVPGFVLESGEEVILTFSSGIITKIESNVDSIKKFFIQQENNAKLNKDFYWNTFAELGIGLNPALKKLSGNSLFDEKMAGTIHIAIGDNSAFGHHIRSNIHLDLCILSPNLTVDGYSIISDGKINFSIIQAIRQNKRYIDYNCTNEQKLSLNYSKFEIIDGEVKRRLARAGRVGYVNISDSITSKKLVQLINLFSEGVFTTIKQLQSICPQSLDISNLLSILEHYKILEIEEKTN